MSARANNPREKRRLLVRAFCFAYLQEVTAHDEAKPKTLPGCSELTRDGWCPKHRPASRQSRRGASGAYHSWYSKAVWTQELRPAQLLREPFCRVCAAKGWRTPATVVDHVIPFRGDWDLFVSPANHLSLCKFHHDQKTAREQAESRGKESQL